MKKFINKLLSNSSEVSSKRFIGLLSFFMVGVFSFSIVFRNSAILNQDLVIKVFDTLFLIIAATILGGTIESVFTTFKGQNSKPVE